VFAPGRFLAVASELNAVAAIDRAIMERALADLELWQRAKVPVPRVSVNVSAGRLSDEALIAHLQESRIVPGTLSFELVESIFMDDNEAFSSVAIDQIKALGIDVEIDDFGTGHASIVSLLKLNPKRLKIDRQFISPILDSVEHSRLVSAIIEMGKSLGIEVIAEGVETMEQAQLLRKLGCDAFQGFAFARPMTAEELVGFIQGTELRRAS
jgi:EAL domain-containing protein (putative c-di-GMP-specific phosphodiesterase class I)